MNYCIRVSLKARIIILYLFNVLLGIEELGTLSFFLGIEVSYMDQGITMSQKKFTSELIRDSCIQVNKRAITPLLVHLKLHYSDSPLFSDPTLYRSLEGKLNFLTYTRPDLSYPVQTLSQYMQTPTELHFQALTHTRSYVANTAGQGILLNGSDQLHLQAFSDSD